MEDDELAAHFWTFGQEALRPEDLDNISPRKIRFLEELDIVRSMIEEIIMCD